MDGNAKTKVQIDETGCRRPCHDGRCRVQLKLTCFFVVHQENNNSRQSSFCQIITIAQQTTGILISFGTHYIFPVDHSNMNSNKRMWDMELEGESDGANGQREGPSLYKK